MAFTLSRLEPRRGRVAHDAQDDIVRQPDFAAEGVVPGLGVHHDPADAGPAKNRLGGGEGMIWVYIRFFV